jgi:hypothetical protein
MRVPQARGDASSALVAYLTAPEPTATAAARLDRAARMLAGATGDPVTDEDLQLSLLLCYELHYRGLDGVDDTAEWDPVVIAARRRLEDRFAAGLARAIPVTDHGGLVSGSLAALVAAQEAQDTRDGLPSLSAYVRKRATLEQVRELLVHRSVYQLKEADPHSWGIPRLSGRAKAALVEIQYDEYGCGRPDAMHAALFARTLRTLGLDDTYGAYVDLVPATTLATTNAMSMFGLNRRWRGALAGHLAAFEMSSSLPNGRYADGLRRLGFDRTATEFFDVHVEADAVHEQVAAVDLCGGVVDAEPGLRADVLFGAAVCAALDSRSAALLVTTWQQRESALRPAVALADACA